MRHLITYMHGYSAWHGPELSDRSTYLWRVIAESRKLVGGTDAYSEAFGEFFFSLPRTRLFIARGEDLEDERSWPMSEEAYEAAFRLLCQDQAVLWGTDEGADFWQYDGRIFLARDVFTPEDVRALVHAQDRRKELALSRAHSVADTRGTPLPIDRPPIPDDVKIFVWKRDGGRCTRCSSNQNLEFVYIIPLAMGGSNTARNLQLLCEPCNWEKGVNLA